MRVIDKTSYPWVCNGIGGGIANAIPAAYGCKVGTNGYLNRNDGFAAMCVMYENENFL